MFTRHWCTVLHTEHAWRRWSGVRSTDCAFINPQFHHPCLAAQTFRTSGTLLQSLESNERKGKDHYSDVNLASRGMISEKLEQNGSREGSLCGRGSLTTFPTFIGPPCHPHQTSKRDTKSVHSRSWSKHRLVPISQYSCSSCSTDAAEADFISVSVDGWMAKSVARVGNDIIH